MKLSVVIVEYNSGPYLPKCLAALFKSLEKFPGQSEVIVVDNSQREDLDLPLLSKLTYIRNPDNLGFGRANNIGLRRAQGKYILSLNHDTECTQGALSTLVYFMEQHPDVGACGGRLLNRDGSIQYQCRRGFPTPWNIFCYISGLSNIFPKIPLFNGYLLRHLDESDLSAKEVAVLSGACLMVRREVIETVGIMDEDYFMYGEDIDWCFRIKECGWKVYYVPAAQITHYGGKGATKNPYRIIYEFHRSMIIFFRKHLKKSYFFPFRWVIYSVIILKLFYALIVNFFRKEKVVGTKKP